MKFVVEIKGQKTNIDVEKLSEILMLESTKRETEHQTATPYLSEAVTKYLQQQEMMSDLTLNQICTIAMDVGYVFNNFMKNQNVEIVNELSDESATSSSNNPQGQASSSNSSS